MNYIVLDMEWNQPYNEQALITAPFAFDSEIIEIGAVKLGDDFEPVDEFSTYIRPAFYPVMMGAVVRLTRIWPKLLEEAPAFPEAYEAFRTWCGPDFCLCTWSTTDIRVLLDNLIMHGVPTEPSPLFCDLQRVFGRELLRERRQCSLEAALSILGLKGERAHDALHDARNTVLVCGRMELADCVDEYITSYVNYEQDRLGGLIGGVTIPAATDIRRDSAFGTFPCPYCGGAVTLGGWAEAGGGLLYGSGMCAEEHEFLARFKFRRAGKAETAVKRLIYDMSDDLWDTYQQALEQAES